MDDSNEILKSLDFSSLSEFDDGEYWDEPCPHCGDWRCEEEECLEEEDDDED